MPTPVTLQHAEAVKAGSTRQLGMWVFLGSVTSLFIATLAAVVITRLFAERWPSERIEELRGGLLISTVCLALCSLSLLQATRALDRNRERKLLQGLWAAGGFALLFLAAQAQNMLHAWSLLHSTEDLYAFTFSLITGVHALHIVGGLVPLALVIQRARQREYSSSRSQGVRLCAQYWHFLGAIWLVILVVLLVL
jgi:heme/copper-type cytochrome/quinol oxidase subunit 3